MEPLYLAGTIIAIAVLVLILVLLIWLIVIATQSGNTPTYIVGTLEMKDVSIINGDKKANLLIKYNYKIDKIPDNIAIEDEMVKILAEIKADSNLTELSKTLVDKVYDFDEINSVSAQLFVDNATYSYTKGYISPLIEF